MPDKKVPRPLTLNRFKVKTASLRRPVTKLALLIPAKKVMTNPGEGTPHGGEDVGATEELQELEQAAAADSL